MMFLQWHLEPRRADETPEQVFEHNLAAADAAHDVPLFVATFTAWRTLRPTETLQDLEKRLRAKNLGVHLIASHEQAPAPGAVCVQPWADDRPAKHSVRYCVSPREVARKELLQTWPSYAANFAALADCGVFTLSKETGGGATSPHNAGHDGDVVPLDSDVDKAFVEQIRSNSARVRRRTPKEVIDEIDADLTRRCGKPPEHKIFALTADGRPVMGLVCADGVHAVGYALDGRGHVELFDMRNAL